MEPETVTEMRHAQDAVCRSLKATTEAMLSDRIRKNPAVVAEHAAALMHLQKAEALMYAKADGEESEEQQSTDISELVRLLFGKSVSRHNPLN